MPAFGVEAVLPVELAHTAEGVAVMAAEGAGVRVTACEAVAVHPFASVTVTLSMVVPDAPAV